MMHLQRKSDLLFKVVIVPLCMYTKTNRILAGPQKHPVLRAWAFFFVVLKLRQPVSENTNIFSSSQACSSFLSVFLLLLPWFWTDTCGVPPWSDKWHFDLEISVMRLHCEVELYSAETSLWVDPLLSTNTCVPQTISLQCQSVVSKIVATIVLFRKSSMLWCWILFLSLPVPCLLQQRLSVYNQAVFIPSYSYEVKRG